MCGICTALRPWADECDYAAAGNGSGGGSGVNTSVTASGNSLIDGVLQGRAWTASEITFSFPTDNSEYSSDEAAGLIAASAGMREAVRAALELDWGSSANDGFSVEGFTNLSFRETAEEGADIRVASTTSDPYNFGTAWAYYPSTGSSGGDAWFHTGNYDYTDPQQGNYAWHTVWHELGHNLGLSHGHEDNYNGALPTEYDSVEYSVMTYRSYVGDNASGYNYETWGAPQTFMMADIAALQHLYGADFETNSGDTVYSWNASSGITYVNGEAGTNAGGNVIFATIWDGGGIDTYDLSAYTLPVSIDLSPGAASTFSFNQLAYLGGYPNSQYASGNIYNALQYQGDERSLIENAIGGSSVDIITGNAARNRLEGGDGNDTMSGGAANDLLFGGANDDVLDGGDGVDRLWGMGGWDQVEGGRGDDRILGGNGRDTLNGGEHSDWIRGGLDADVLNGGKDNDELHGGAGFDTINGGTGADTLTGGGGADTFLLTDIADAQVGAGDIITDWDEGVDKLDFSAIDAVSGGSSDEAFTFVGAASFSGAGELSFETDGVDGVLMGDVDGDLVADFEITLLGITSIDQSDLLL
ncbi:MAG: M10 family metallopeptidase C-terminal domain-containing protein [Pseudomonadota bacterium]